MDWPVMGERGNRLYKILDKYLGIPLTLPAALLRKLEKPAECADDPHKIGILCFGAIGDLMLLTGLINGIRKQAPKAHIEIILSSANSQAAPLLPDIDSAQIFPIKNIPRLAFFIRRQKYDLLFDSTQWARVGNLLSNFSKAGIIIGFKTRGQYRSLGYDRIVEHKNDVHEAENFLNLGKAIWPEFHGEPHLNLKILENYPSRAEAETSGKKIIFCHMYCAPGKFNKLKQWPEDLWARLINRLLPLNFQIHLTGALYDREKLADFIRKYGFSNVAVKNLAGETTLTELAKMFAKSAAVIAINTGPMHIAALAGAKIITLNGPAGPKRWGAWSRKTVALLPTQGEYDYINLGFEYPRDPKPCMQYISVNAVMEALAKLHVIDPD